MEKNLKKCILLCFSTFGIIWGIFGARLFLVEKWQILGVFAALGILVYLFGVIIPCLGCHTALPAFHKSGWFFFAASALLAGAGGVFFWGVTSRISSFLPHTYLWESAGEQGAFLFGCLGALCFARLLLAGGTGGVFQQSAEGRPFLARPILAFPALVLGCGARAVCLYFGGGFLGLLGLLLSGGLVAFSAWLCLGDLKPAPGAPSETESAFLWGALPLATLAAAALVIGVPWAVKWEAEKPVQPPAPQNISVQLSPNSNSEVPLEAVTAKALLDAYVKAQNGALAESNPDSILKFVLNAYSIEKTDSSGFVLLASVEISVKDSFREVTLYGKPASPGSAARAVWQLTVHTQGDTATLTSLKAVRTKGQADFTTYAPTFYPESDYYLNNGQLYVLKDYGSVQIQVPVSPAAVQATGDGNTNGRGIIPGSYQLNDTLYAFSYGGADWGAVMLSSDRGDTWSTTAKLPFPEAVRARFISFYTPKEGWFAMGGNRLMGMEGYLLARTEDGGATWQPVPLPAELSFSYLLSGIAFADGQHGFLSFDVPDEDPAFWCTTDGKTFLQATLPIPQNLRGYLYKVDSYTLSGSEGSLVVGQGSYGGKKAIFVTADGGASWTFEKSWEESAHYNG